MYLDGRCVPPPYYVCASVHAGLVLSDLGRSVSASPSSVSPRLEIGQPLIPLIVLCLFWQERLPMTLPKIVELVTKKDIPALQRYLIFEVRKIKQFFLYNSADSMAWHHCQYSVSGRLVI